MYVQKSMLAIQKANESPWNRLAAKHAPRLGGKAGANQPAPPEREMRFLAGLIAVCLVSGCGGDSSSSAPPSSTPSSAPGPVVSTLAFPIEQTMVALATTPSTFTASATDSRGNNYFLTVSYAPGPNTLYPLISTSSLPTAYKTAQISVNGGAPTVSIEQVFYSTGPFLIKGVTDGTSYDSTTTHEYLLTTLQVPLPTFANVGDSGPFYSGIKYRTFCFRLTDCSLPENYETIDLGRMTAAWLLEADTETTAWSCNNISHFSSTNALRSTERDCIKINQVGSLLAFKADITANGTTLRFR